MIAIKLLEKLGADAKLDPNPLSQEDRRNLDDIIQKAKIFNAVEIVHALDEEEGSEEAEEKPEN